MAHGRRRFDSLAIICCLCLYILLDCNNSFGLAFSPSNCRLAHSSYWSKASALETTPASALLANTGCSIRRSVSYDKRSSTADRRSFVLFQTVSVAATEGGDKDDPTTTVVVATAAAAPNDGGQQQSRWRKLFQQGCDADGYMTFQAVQQMPNVQELLDDGDVLLSELQSMWDRAPKAKNTTTTSIIGVDAFVQILQEMDDLFEDDEDDDDDSHDSGDADASAALVVELESSFQQLCDDQCRIDQTTLYQWDEIQDLLNEGLLGKDELDTLWTTATAADGSSFLDKAGFGRFNAALDDLFEMEDDDDDDDNEKIRMDFPVPSTTTTRMIQGADLSPDVLFVALANADGLVGRDELQQWQELQDMLSVEDLLPSELDTLYKEAVAKTNDDGMLTEDGFAQLFRAIDDLFEDDDNDDDGSSSIAGAINADSSTSATTPPQPTSKAAVIALKTELLAVVAELDQEDSLPCGLDASDDDIKEVLSIVEDLEKEKSNFVRQQLDDVAADQVLGGTWDLIFSSSSAMKFNQGLSGLGGSFPNGRFASLRQKLIATKYLRDVEYTERIEVTPSSASFDVVVTGSWEVRKSVSLFTGEPSMVVAVEPDRVTYGPTSTRADHWKSLGPMNLLDITYLDKDMRIMRGNTSVDTVFIFQRSG